MKKIKGYYVLILLVVFVFFSCGGSDVNTENIYFTEDDLPAAIQLVGNKYSYPEILNPYGVFLKNGKAIVYELKNVTNDKFHIIDLQNNKYLQSKGVDGIGPGEISVISQIEETSQENEIVTFDPELLLYSKFDLTDTSKLAVEQFKAPEMAHYITEAVWTSDSTLLGNLVDGWTKYLHLNKSGDTLALFGSWKDMIKGREFPRGVKENELDANLVSNLFQGPLRISKDKRHAIKFGKKVDFIDIIDVEKRQIKTVYGPTQEIQDFGIRYWDGYQMPVMPAASTSRYGEGYAGINSFFVLFRGKPYSQISSPENLNRIFEFDYNGNILHQYQLDYPIFGFAVDEENRAIYGVTVDREPNLVRFDY